MAQGDYLSSLITILAAIPLASHLTLRIAADLDQEYIGHESHWWSGTPIQHSHAVDTEDDRQFGHREEALLETIRLFAFLRGTTRAYGSVEPLASSLDSATQSDPLLSSQSKVSKFLSIWYEQIANFNEDIEDQVWDATALRSVISITKSDGSVQRKDQYDLDITLDNGARGPTRSLYDVLDGAIWAEDQDGDSPTETAIERCADLLVMRVWQPDGQATGLNMRVPATWYADRYLPENVAVTKEMRRNMSRFRHEMRRIEEKKQTIETYKHPKTGKSEDAMSLIQAAASTLIRQAKLQTQKQNTDILEPPEDDEDEEGETGGDPMEVDTPLAELPRIVQKLQDVYQNIKRKLQSLEEQKEGARATMEEISDLLKDPPAKETTASRVTPQRAYRLCGASTDPHVLYLRYPTSLVGDAESRSYQWWKIHYTHEATITKTTISEAEVLKAASEDSRNALLVYASDNALYQQFPALSMDLQVCVPSSALFDGFTDMCRPSSITTAMCSGRSWQRRKQHGWKQGPRQKQLARR